ncbi:MAG: hypothetical protein HY543_09880 [Deltaproteobacteria bacterium]|nr:hypothetical protein [Deltaproteobacteria bacterium]
MKTPKLLGVVERQAGRQATRLMAAARKSYDGFMRSAAKASNVTAQRRYIRAAEQTVAGAEKIIAQLKKRIAAAKKLLPGGRKRKVKRTTKRQAKRRAKRPVVKRTARKKRG